MRDVTPVPGDHPEPMPRYVGQSWFVHWWPWFMVVFGLVQVLTDKRFAGYAIFSCSDAFIKHAGTGSGLFVIGFFVTLFSMIPWLAR